MDRFRKKIAHTGEEEEIEQNRTMRISRRSITQLYLIVFLCLPFAFAQISSFQDLLMLGTCEEFDNQPVACQAVMVGPWSQVWTVPAYGLTQEYWQAQMNTLQNTTGNGPPLPPIDLPQIYPLDCATQYLKLICPTFFRPCSTPDPNSGIPFPAIPHPVCRSVCEVSSISLSTSLSLFDCSTHQAYSFFPRLFFVNETSQGIQCCLC